MSGYAGEGTCSAAKEESLRSLRSLRNQQQRIDKFFLSCLRMGKGPRCCRVQTKTVRLGGCASATRRCFIASNTMKKIASVELYRKVTDSKLSVNKHAAQAAANAKAKGWKTWSMLDQCDVLDMATVVSQKPGTTWYFVLYLEEDTEVLWKVQAVDYRQVLNEYLQYHHALVPFECRERFEY